MESKISRRRREIFDYAKKTFVIIRFLSGNCDYSVIIDKKFFKVYSHYYVSYQITKSWENSYRDL